jgi:hypothetical protein
MPSATSIKPDSRFFGLFIGRSGSGKSAAAYSFPHPIKVLDLDGRIRGGLVPWVEREGIDYTYYPPKPDKGTVFDLLNNDFAAMQVMCRTGQNYFKTLVLDSITWNAIDLLLDAIPLTHAAGSGNDKGKSIGGMQIGGPADYQFQSTGIYQIIAFLKSLPIPNIIVTAHTVGRWGKRKDANGKILDPYGPSELIGEQLSLTDKLAENVPSSFDNVFKFEKLDTGSQIRFFFEAQGELARSAYPELPYQRMDVTGKDFYKFLMDKVQPSAQNALLTRS